MYLPSVCGYYSYSKTLEEICLMGDEYDVYVVWNPKSGLADTTYPCERY